MIRINSLNFNFIFNLDLILTSIHSGCGCGVIFVHFYLDFSCKFTETDINWSLFTIPGTPIYLSKLWCYVKQISAISQEIQMKMALCKLMVF